jgi:OTU domain-containing protein 6
MQTYVCIYILYAYIGALCADTLQANQDEFAPFCEYSDGVTNFDQYADRVRKSAEWGGHLELRALGMALDRPIQVYSLQMGSKPLSIHDEQRNEGKTTKAPIRLSYHLHYYALGEHYNQIVEA